MVADGWHHIGTAFFDSTGRGMEVLFPTLFLMVLGFVLLLNLLTLPANWIMLGLIVVWRAVYPQPGGMGFLFFALLVGLAVLGEVIEYVTQGWGSKKYGSSTSGMWAGLLGAMIGALAGLPFLLGIGALIGALVGAWGGCYLMERYHGKNDQEARQAAKGALVGRFLGIVIKCGIGGIMLGLTCKTIFTVPDVPTIIVL